ncbi:chloride-dependent neutral and basic amino acid transporter B [Seminavis robusta]|uniref:Chloride-dependent neutral and basic amino acid transporter B n=1 Tax=Seminavis robusta TaxID=568900 RepID=A0A9N8E1F2_9STRA|nr:chloride-dependent neutral and basic amino acid transporter B [Seminavis robusta]|eukprot:Sro410_g137420.1 chloride-dependent neutral and basic amino acid transporter B (804) ;mRNA; r:43350-45940
MTTPVELLPVQGPLEPPLPAIEPSTRSSSSIQDDGAPVVLDYNNNNINNSSSVVRRHDKERPEWSSQLTYTCGALLSIPLSQLWRGAAMLGGSLSVYASLAGLLLAMCVIGLPLYLLELGWGHKYQVGAVGIWQLPHFGTAKKQRRWTGLGVAGMLLGLVYACFCMGILAWTLHALLDTFGVNLLMLSGQQQATDTNNPWTHIAQNNHSLSDRQQAVEIYWVDQVVGQHSLSLTSERYFLQPTRLVYENVATCGVLWAIVAVITSLGIRQLGRISFLITTTSLILLIAVFVGSLTITHDNTDEDYTTKSSMWEDFASSMDQDDVLSESIVQTLYITGILLGIQSAYSSYNSGPSNTNSGTTSSSTPPQQQPFAKIACLITAINVLLVFTTGYVLSKAIPTPPLPFYANTIWNHSLRLVFCHWPAALLTLPGGMAWVRLLYTCLLMMGIQFPIAVVTSILTVLREDRTSAVARWKIALVSCLVGFSVSLVFCTDAGLIFLDTMDYYMTLCLLLVGFLESFAAGWMYNMEDQIRSYGILPVIFSILWNFAPVVVAAGVWFGLDSDNILDVDEQYHRMWIGLFGGLMVFLLFFMLAFVSIRRSYEFYVARCLNSSHTNNSSGSSERILHPRDYYLEFSFGNVEALKRNLEASMGGSGCQLPQVWYIFLKRVVPHLLLLVFLKRLLMMIGLPSEDTDGAYLMTTMAFGNYGNYPLEPFQIAGIALFGVAAGVFVVGLVCPPVYAHLVPPPTHVFINRRDTMEEEEEEVGEESSECVNVPNFDELPDMEDPLDVMAAGRGHAYVVEMH